MRQTGHRSLEMVRRYIRNASLFRENVGGSWDCDPDCDSLQPLRTQRLGGSF
jgi:hypothetical protein